MDAELRAVPFALKVCRWVAGEESRNEPANTPAELVPASQAEAKALVTIK